MHDDADFEPELRAGPPWAMEEMIAAQPAVAATLLAPGGAGAGAVADAVARAAAAGEPVTAIGCGTSEHGAAAVAALLEAALRAAGHPAPRVASRASLEALLDPLPGACVAVTHEGATTATLLAMEAAAAAGASVSLITACERSAAAGRADAVLVTPVLDRSWCHTVAYGSAILAGAAVARELGLGGVDGARAEALLDRALGLRGAAAAAAAPLAGAARIVTAGTRADRIHARELALKIAEGARIPTGTLELESVLHGHLAGEDADTALVLVHTDPAPRAERVAALVAAAVKPIRVRVVEVGAGSLALPPEDGLDPLLARLLGGAVALQLLTLELVHARGVNPDLIRREEPAYRAVAQVVADAGAW